ncbi:unnamed protein product [Allacma fusca]|uniref:Uncharacterized protein n=1 Tax=Allacma fusca TaxID=39272 RepID=A0A8J2K199_9HEXA|nr:unnamed protein product [Allacma fusca]
MGQKRRSTVILLLSIVVGIVQLDLFCDGYIVNAEDSKEYLRRYEPVFYNAIDLSEQHIRARRRAKNDDYNVNKEFFLHGRNFQLNLNVDENLFHPNAIIKNSAFPIKYNTRKALSGTIKGNYVGHT